MMQEPTDIYTSFYHLQEEPFSSQTIPEAIYLSPSHAAALEQVCQGIVERHGFIALLGEAGLGKTTLLRSYLNEADPQLVKVIYIETATGTFIDFLTSIAQAFGQEPRVHPLSDMIAQLHQLFTTEYEQGRNIVLVMDDAHNIPIEILEQLPVLSDVTAIDAKLVQIVLVGHPILAYNLRTLSLYQLNSQMRTVVQLPPLSEDESIGYIQQRLSAVATLPSEIFSPAALRKVVQHARGIPQNLNRLCTDALISGFRHKKNPIPFRIVRQVIETPDVTRQARRWRPVVLLPAGAGVLLIAILIGIFLPRHPEEPVSLNSPVVTKSPSPNHTTLSNASEKPAFAKASPEEPPAAVKSSQVEMPPVKTSLAPAETLPVEPTPAPVEPVPASVEPAPASVEPAPVEPPEGKALVQTSLSQIFSNQSDFQLRLQADKNANAVYMEGDPLVIRVMSDMDAYLQFDYYQANGKVVHLVLDPGYHMVAKGEKIVMLGNIRAPFGDETLIVIATQQPQYPSGAPEVSATTYLADLQQRLEQYKTQGKVAIAHLNIHTQKN
jgi:general secretion pathway protein A